MKVVLFHLLVIWISCCTAGQQSLFQPPYNHKIDLRLYVISGQVIFKVNTTSTGQNASFFLLEVNTTKPNVPYVDFSPFVSTALNITIDDCKATYPEPRNHFCIDHTTGEVKMMKLYKEPGIKYQINVRVVAGPDTQSKVYTLDVFDPCVAVHAVVPVAEKNCQTQTFITHESSERTTATTHSYSFDFGNYGRLYMLYMFANVGPFDQKNMIVLETKSGSMTFNSRPYSETHLPYPTLFTSKELFNITVTNTTNSPISSPKNRLTFYYTPVADTCQSTVCRGIAPKFFVGECETSVNKDVMNIRYGSFCDGSTPPVLNHRSLKNEFKYDFYKGVRNSKIIPGPFVTNPGSSVEYSLVSVFGYGTLSYNLTTCALQKDDGQFSFVSGTQFCMNKNTGDLYINGNFPGLMPPAELTFQVLVANLTYPYRAIETNLTARLVDRCAPIGETYIKVVDNCATKSLRTSLLTLDGVFPVSGAVRYLGVEVSKNAKFPDDIVRFSLMFAPITDSNTQIVLTFPDLLSKYKDLNKLLPINDVRNTELMNGNIELFNVIVRGITSSGQLRELKTASSDIKMFYLTDWSTCNNRKCLDVIKSWKSLKNEDPLCKMDSQFFTEMIDPCLDLKPEITGQLSYNEKQNVLQGCSYKSLVNLNQYAYVLLNDTQRINFTGDLEKSPNLGNTYNFPNIRLQSYRQNGYFRCVIYDPERMSSLVSSNSSVFLKMKDPILITPAEVVNLEGSAQRIECTVNLPQGVTITKDELYFLKNGTEKIASTVFLQRENKFVLVIDVLTKSDEGNYQCAAHPDGSNNPVISNPFALKVTDLLASFTSQPTVKQQSTEQFGSVVKVSGCQCQTNGKIDNLAYYVIYSRDKKEIRKLKTTVASHQSNITTFADLIVTNFQNLGSYYACQLFHPDIMPTPLTSNKSSEFRWQVPSFINQKPQNYSHFLGDIIQLPKCTLSLLFKENFTLFLVKDRKKLRTLRTKIAFQNNYIATTEAIILDNATVSTSGIYQCYAGFPGVKWSPIFGVEWKVEVQSRNIEFTSGPKFQKNSRGSLELFGCGYDTAMLTIPSADTTFTWLLNGAILSTTIPTSRPLPARFLRSLDKTTTNPVFPSISIFRYDQAGNYSCRITIGPETVTSKVLHLKDLPAPKFLTKPKATYDKAVGGSLVITGCAVSSTLQLGDNYINWYVNNFPKYPARFKLETNIFDSVEKKQSSTIDQGIYQCGVTLPDGRLVLSDPVIIQFADVSWTTAKIHLDRPFLDVYVQPSTDGYQQLQREVITKLQKGISSYGGKTPDVTVHGFKKGSVLVFLSIMYGGVSAKEQLEICGKKNEMKNSISENFAKATIELQNQNCCPANTVGEASFKGVYSYLVSLANTNSTLPCQYSQSKNSIRQCLSSMNGPIWSKPYLDDCSAKTAVTNNLISLNSVPICTTQQVAGCSTPLVVANELADIVNSSGAITTHQDVDYVANIVQNIVNTKIQANTTFKEAINITDNILSCIDNLISSIDSRSIAVSQIESQTSTSILESLDQIALLIGKKEASNTTGNIFNVIKQNIALSVEFQSPGDVTISAKPVGNNADSPVGIDFQPGDTYNTTKSLVKVRIPLEAFGQKSQIVYSIFYKSNTLLQTPEELLDSVFKNTSSNNRVVNSNVLKVSIGGVTVSDLNEPLLLTFKGKERNQGKVSCEFWNFSLSTEIKGVYGTWSSNGCFVDEINSNDEETACKCYHLTNFAILMDVPQSFDNPLELQIVTWIGCGISLAGLLLTLVTYIAFRDLRKKLPPKILISLCSSLMALLLVFLIGVEQTSSRVGCQIVAAIIQYFMLATFCWMAVEGVNLYRNFVKIFGSGGTGKFLKKASAFGWGLPLVIVIITAASNPDSLGNDRFCVVVGYSFYFGVLLPVAAVMFGNFIVLIMVMRSLTSSNRSQFQKEQDSLAKSARIAFAANILLGTTWVFALFAVGDLREVFQWLFTIFNALQGFFIFIFYTVRNKDARKQWVKLIQGSSKSHGHSSLPTTSDSPSHTLKMNTLSTTNGKDKTNYNNPNMYGTSSSTSKTNSTTLPKY